MTPPTTQRPPRARDAHATKALLLDAATDEFAECGLAGARIDRVAERAGANKRLLYVYFGDKNDLFDAVVAEQTQAVMAAAPMPDGDLCAFAAARFDYMLAHPRARRLANWRAFERSRTTELEREAFQARVDAVAVAQRAGRLRDDVAAVDLFAMVLRLTESWLSAPPGLLATTGEDPMAAARLAEHRTALLAAVRRVVEPTSG
ncbi:TetR/AcrR family transcriptional regulator [Catellatospora methionotrophica]|uniref:TetR/AcrR family transcriptional regulator n=1 Tax=Catellatospora methionotrophica TaxID=121620 RepID=UPI0033D50CBB